MVHTRVSDEYRHFSLMYTTGHILPVLPTKHLINQDGEPTIPHNLENIMKPSVSNPCVLFCPCVVQKQTAHVDTKELNMCHQPKICFRGIFVGIPQHQKVYLINIPSTQKIVSSHDVIFDETFYSALDYTLHMYLEALTM